MANGRSQAEIKVSPKVCVSITVTVQKRAAPKKQGLIGHRWLVGDVGCQGNADEELDTLTTFQNIKKSLREPAGRSQKAGKIYIYLSGCEGEPVPGSSLPAPGAASNLCYSLAYRPITPASASVCHVVLALPVWISLCLFSCFFFKGPQSLD